MATLLAVLCGLDRGYGTSCSEWSGVRGAPVSRREVRDLERDLGRVQELEPG
jgi:hypothetical protein